MATISKININGVNYDIGGSGNGSIIPVTSLDREEFATLLNEQIMPAINEDKAVALYLDTEDEKYITHSTGSYDYYKTLKNGLYVHKPAYAQNINGAEIYDYIQGDGTSYVPLREVGPGHGTWSATMQIMWTDVQTTQNMGSNSAGYFGVSGGYYTFMGEPTEFQAEANKMAKIYVSYYDNPFDDTYGGTTGGITGGITGGTSVVLPGVGTTTGGYSSREFSVYVDDVCIGTASTRVTNGGNPVYSYFNVLGCYNLPGTTARLYSLKGGNFTSYAYYDREFYPCANEDGVATIVSEDYGIEEPSGTTLILGTKGNMTHEFTITEPLEEDEWLSNKGYTKYTKTSYCIKVNVRDNEIISIWPENNRETLSIVDIDRYYGSAYNPTSSYNPTTKKYVDDKITSENANKLSYIDNGYYKKPTGWTVVSEEPAWFNSSVIYFVCPDYVLDTMFTNVRWDGLNSGTTYSHITTNFVKPDSGDIVETWQSTVPDGTTTSATTQTEVKMFKYDVNVGATPMFTDTTGDNLYLTGYIEFRDPESTALRWQVYLDEENITSGTLYWFDEDDMGELTPTDYAINLGGGYMSIGIYYTVGTNSGLACLAKGTKITVPGNKTKAIDKLKVGDKVIDAEGNETTITKIYNHKVPMVFDITLPNGEIVTASSHHKFKIGKFFRKACQVAVGSELVRQDSSTYKVSDCSVREEEIEVYEILTESNTYTLANGLICECEAI